ncbi:hypothetical protein [Actinoallomurus soli]|uniref:hypothetical protein n=1 Tax=Actinoallomurus soli TaxID=2952535 RepID=UPI00209394A1|nr:hypothetical protein [Actinoallomurus soli]MCO5975051.1 hypothetical protein [Actinoallomurus soli]
MQVLQLGLAAVGIEVEVVERNLAQTGFVPQAKRWVVERAYGILTLHRRLVRDYEHRPRSSESRVYWAMTAVILRRLAIHTEPGDPPSFQDHHCVSPVLNLCGQYS